MDNYRINKKELLNEIGGWNSFLKRKMYLIACGGTALTFLGLKESTKDIDFMVPRIDEYNYLIATIKKLGYKSVTGNGWKRDGKYVFDLFRGNYIHTTELLESPLLKGNHTPFEEFSYIYIGILNFYDLIISKLFRGAEVDFEDCLILYEGKKNQIDINKLEARFKETASYDIASDRMVKNLEIFLEKIKKE
ncbi:MAG: DUF6036 family nucleotidyltransferase [Candidatus Omnitrophota bacterium]